LIHAILLKNKKLFILEQVELVLEGEELRNIKFEGGERDDKISLFVEGLWEIKVFEIETF